MEWAKDNRKTFLIVLGLSLFLFFFRLGDRSFRNPDEGRYAQIAGQMVSGGNWLEPKLFGIDYLRKPPLFYWLIASSFRVFGKNEWAARAVPALFGVMGVLSVYFFTRKVFGARAALFSSLILLSNPWYLHVSRYLVIDSVFSFFVTAGIFFFYLARTEQKTALLYDSGFYTCVALAFLAKGLLALVLPGFSILIYALWTGQLGRFLKESRLFLGLGIFLLITAPWFWWMSRHKPDFWNVFFVREHLARFTSVNFEHQEGWYFYFVLLAGFLLPWVLLPGPMRLFFGGTAENERKNPSFFALIFALSTVAFLSLSKSKLATYILPVIPPLGVVLGYAWARWTENAEDRLRIFYVFFIVLVLSAFPVIFIMEKVNPDYSTKSFALRVLPKIKAEDAVYVYDHPGPFYDFPFYLKHAVKPVGLAGELEISREDPEAVKIAITQADFQKLLKEKVRFYCVMRQSDWRGIPEEAKRSLKVLAEDDRKMIFESGAA